jgi:hypothetical protein
LLKGLLDKDRRAGGHWNGLRHPRLSLDVGLLRIRSGTLVEERLVLIIGASDEWHSLHAARVLLRVGGWTVEWG